MNKSKSLIYFLFATALCLCDVNSAMAGQKNNSGENNNATEQVCQMGGKEKEFARLLINHPDQTHKSLECNPVLQKFAESRAEDLATRGYFSHVTPENTGPNELLENLGYVLPDTYIHGRHNSIESMGGGIAEPDKMLEALLGSKAHRDHLLGLSHLYNEQDEFGIGYYYLPDSPLRWYWVIIIARKQKPSDKNYICTPEPVTCITW